nr:efflux pump patc [Quercus suber]
MCILFVEVATSATCVFVPIYFLPLYFQFVQHVDAIIAGVRLLPFVAFQVVTTIASGYIIGKTGYYVPWYIAAGVLCIPGAALLYTVTQDTSLAKIYGYEILLATGAGATVQASFPVAQIKVKPGDIPRAVGWCTLAQLGGPTIALSIANAVFLNRAQLGVSNVLPNLSGSQVTTIISDPTSPLLRNLSPETQNAVIGAIVHAMSKVYILAIVAGALTLILCFRFKINDKLFG